MLRTTTRSSVLVTPPSSNTALSDQHASILIDEGNAARDEGPWKECNDAAKSLTNETYLSWKDEIEKLLVFAGLFSGVVTPFTNAAIRTVIENTNPSISNYSQQISLFFSLSLALSLSAVLGGIVCLQWLREFEKNVPGISSREDLYHRYQRHEGLRRWGVFAILNSLPLIFLSALSLFFAGFIEFLWSSHVLAAIPVAVIAGILLLFIIVTSILPAAQVIWFVNWRKPNADTSAILCPYRSPQAWIIHHLLKSAIKFLQKFLPFLRNMWDTFKDLDSWAAYDTWKDKRYQNETSIFPPLYWVLQHRKQHSKVALETYRSFLHAIHSGFEQLVEPKSNSENAFTFRRITSDTFPNEAFTALPEFQSLNVKMTAKVGNDLLAAFNVLYSGPKIQFDALLSLLQRNSMLLSHIESFKSDTLGGFLRVFMHIAGSTQIVIPDLILCLFIRVFIAISRQPHRRKRRDLTDTLKDATLAFLRLVVDTGTQARVELVPHLDDVEFQPLTPGTGSNTPVDLEDKLIPLHSFLKVISKCYVEGDDEWRRIHLQIFNSAYTLFLSSENVASTRVGYKLSIICRLLPDMQDYHRIRPFDLTTLPQEIATRYVRSIRDFARKGLDRKEHSSEPVQWLRSLRLVPHVIAGTIGVAYVNPKPEFLMTLRETLAIVNDSFKELVHGGNWRAGRLATELSIEMFIHDLNYYAPNFHEKVDKEITRFTDQLVQHIPQATETLYRYPRGRQNSAYDNTPDGPLSRSPYVIENHELPNEDSRNPTLDPGISRSSNDSDSDNDNPRPSTHNQAPGPPRSQYPPDGSDSDNNDPRRPTPRRVRKSSHKSKSSQPQGGYVPTASPVYDPSSDTHNSNRDRNSARQVISPTPTHATGSMREDVRNRTPTPRHSTRKGKLSIPQRNTNEPQLEDRTTTGTHRERYQAPRQTGSGAGGSSINEYEVASYPIEVLRQALLYQYPQSAETPNTPANSTYGTQRHPFPSSPPRQPLISVPLQQQPHITSQPQTQGPDGQEITLVYRNPEIIPRAAVLPQSQISRQDGQTINSVHTNAASHLRNPTPVPSSETISQGTRSPVPRVQAPQSNLQVPRNPIPPPPRRGWNRIYETENPANTRTAMADTLNSTTNQGRMPPNLNFMRSETTTEDVTQHAQPRSVTMPTIHDSSLASSDNPRNPNEPIVRTHEGRFYMATIPEAPVLQEDYNKRVSMKDPLLNDKNIDGEPSITDALRTILLFSKLIVSEKVEESSQLERLEPFVKKVLDDLSHGVGYNVSGRLTWFWGSYPATDTDRQISSTPPPNQQCIIVPGPPQPELYAKIADETEDGRGFTKLPSVLPSAVNSYKDYNDVKDLQRSVFDPSSVLHNKLNPKAHSSPKTTLNGNTISTPLLEWTVDVSCHVSEYISPDDNNIPTQPNELQHDVVTEVSDSSSLSSTQDITWYTPMSSLPDVEETNNQIAPPSRKRQVHFTSKTVVIIDDTDPEYLQSNIQDIQYTTYLFSDASDDEGEGEGEGEGEEQTDSNSDMGRLHIRHNTIIIIPRRPGSSASDRSSGDSNSIDSNGTSS